MLDVVVSRLTHEAEGVVGVELRAAAGGLLPPSLRAHTWMCICLVDCADSTPSPTLRTSKSDIASG